MADVVYTINYDDEHGLTTHQGIETIGTSPDRVRFVTNTTEYKMALKRDEKKNPRMWPLTGIPDPYLIPPAKGAPQWIDVTHSGIHDQFHYICGYIDDNGVFQAWKPAAKPAGVYRGAAAAPAAANSLPWPVL